MRVSHTREADAFQMTVCPDEWPEWLSVNAIFRGITGEMWLRGRAESVQRVGRGDWILHDAGTLQVVSPAEFERDWAETMAEGFRCPECGDPRLLVCDACGSDLIPVRKTT